MALQGPPPTIRIVQNEAALTASRLLQDKINSDPRFEVHTGTVLEEFRGEGKLEEVVARETQSGREIRWHPAAAFIFIGQTPNSQLLGGVADLDRWGFVITDDAYRTSLPGVYAAGDVRARSTKQLASTVGEGAAALLSVRSYLQKHDHLATVDVNS